MIVNDLLLFRVEWDYPYQKLLEEGTIPIWKEVNHLRQIYRFGHNHYLRQVIDRVHSRYCRGFRRGSLWATDIGIINHSLSLLRDEGVVAGKHNKDYIGGAKKLIQHVFKGQTQPNSLEYTDFMGKVNSMSKIENLIGLYFHPLNFTAGERLMFPIAALVRLNFKKIVDVNGKDVSWSMAYGKYCSTHSYEYVSSGINLPPRKQIRKVDIGKIASHSEKFRGLYYGFNVYSGKTHSHNTEIHFWRNFSLSAMQ